MQGFSCYQIKTRIKNCQTVPPKNSQIVPGSWLGRGQLAICQPPKVMILPGKSLFLRGYAMAPASLSKGNHRLHVSRLSQQIYQVHAFPKSWMRILEAENQLLDFELLDSCVSGNSSSEAAWMLPATILGAP